MRTENKERARLSAMSDDPHGAEIDDQLAAVFCGDEDEKIDEQAARSKLGLQEPTGASLAWRMEWQRAAASTVRGECRAHA